MGTLLRVRTFFTGIQGAPYLSTAWFTTNNGTTASTANAAVGTFWSHMAVAMNDQLHYSTDGAVAEIDSATGEPTGIIAVTPQTGAGTSTVDLLPRQAQGLLSLRTGVFSGGRELRGHWFLPGWTTGNNTGGAPDSGAISLANSGAAAVISTRSGDWCVYSRKHRSVAPVTAATMNSNWATLNSRRD